MTQEADKNIHPLNAMRSGIHVARHPGRIVSKQVKKRLEKRGVKHRLVDALVIGTLIALTAAITIWALRADPGRRVAFTAVVAPTDIVSGGDSTLSIGYTNRSKKTLEDVTLTLAYPPYFALQDVDHPTFEPQTNTIELGSLAPGANGLIKIRGVMFGDVGGDQYFLSTLAYRWNETRTGARERSYHFVPQRSALRITTTLPDRLVSGQSIAGNITLENTGPVTFPEASIHAVFPDGFTLRDTSQAQREDETWVIPSIEPGETLEISYAGALALDETETATFLFEPSFVFGDERFVQDALTETVETIPPPITVQIEAGDITTNGTIPTTIRFERVSDVNVRDIVISVEGATNTPSWDIDTPLVPSERTVDLIPAARGVNRSATLTPVVEFTLTETGDRVRVEGTSIERRLPTPVQLNSFARYFTSAGDQLGRGTLPPRTGEKTLYWAFMNVQGTYNDLENVTVTASLPANVAWVGQQSVTRGSGVQYDAANHRLVWTIGDLPATVTTNSIAAASVALEIIPTAAQVGSRATLLQQVRLQGTDTWVNESIQRSAAGATTAIPEDSGIIR